MLHDVKEILCLKIIIFTDFAKLYLGQRKNLYQRCLYTVLIISINVFFQVTLHNAQSNINLNATSNRKFQSSLVQYLISAEIQSLPQFCGCFLQNEAKFNVKVILVNVARSHLKIECKCRWDAHADDHR